MHSESDPLRDLAPVLAAAEACSTALVCRSCFLKGCVPRRALDGDCRATHNGSRRTPLVEPVIPHIMLPHFPWMSLMDRTTSERKRGRSRHSVSLESRHSSPRPPAPAAHQSGDDRHLALNGLPVDARSGASASFEERSGAPSNLRPSSFVMCGCLNYPCRTPKIVRDCCFSDTAALEQWG
jgi:hypothetical protein